MLSSLPPVSSAQDRLSLSKLSMSSKSNSVRYWLSCFCTSWSNSSFLLPASTDMACAKVVVYSASNVPGKRTKYVLPRGWRFCHSPAAASAILVLPMPAKPHSTWGFRFSFSSSFSRFFTSSSRPFTSLLFSAPAFWARLHTGGVRRRRHSSICRAISSSVMRSSGASFAAAVSSAFT